MYTLYCRFIYELGMKLSKVDIEKWSNNVVYKIYTY